MESDKVMIVPHWGKPSYLPIYQGCYYCINHENEPMSLKFLETLEENNKAKTRGKYSPFIIVFLLSITRDEGLVA